MSFFSLPKGFFRASTNAFIPNTMIDVLFDYNEFFTNTSAGIGTAPTSSNSVLVIGAGAAGLVCAYELSRIGVNVTVLEASDRVGGRMYSISNPDGANNPKIFEMGCMRFPPSSYTLFHYLNFFKIPTSANFPDPGKVLTNLYYENGLILWPANDPAPQNADFQRIGTDFNAMLTFILGDPNNVNTENPTTLFDYWNLYQTQQTNLTDLINSWQQIIDEYRNISYYDAIYTLGQNTNIVIQPWSDEDMNKFGALGIGSGGFGPLYQVNFIEILRLIANGWENQQTFLPSGIGSLVDKFQDAIGADQIVTNKRVVNISKVAGEFIATCDDNSIYTAPCIVVATTTPAMEFMGLTLGLPTPILQEQTAVAIRNLHLMSSSKLFVLTESKFWYAANNALNIDLPSNIQTDESLRGLYCLDYDQSPGTDGMGVVLISYVWGDDSTKLQALTATQRLTQFIETLAIINSNFCAAFSSAIVQGSAQYIDWQNTPDFYGAFKLNYPGQEEFAQNGFFQFQNNQGLILAGDSVSFAGGWLEGAMPTGINAACAALSFIGGTLNPELTTSPIDIPATMYNYSNS